MLYANRARQQYVEEYGKLLLDCITGDQTLFVSTGEIREMWRAIDPVIATWQAGKVPLASNPPDTLAARGAAQVIEQSTDRISRLHPPLGMIGLGKMGGNLVRQLLVKGWPVVGYNRSPLATKLLASEGMVPAMSLTELVAKLPKPRTVWLMVPSYVTPHAGQTNRAPIDDV